MLYIIFIVMGFTKQNIKPNSNWSPQILFTNLNEMMSFAFRTRVTLTDLDFVTKHWSSRPGDK